MEMVRVREIQKNYCVKKVGENLLAAQNILRNAGKYCDFTLKTEDGGSILAHRLILESSSSFFSTMFNSNFHESSSESLLLIKVSSDGLERIVNFMYTGKVKITSVIVKELLDNALFLGVMDLVDACTEFLVQIVHYTNCFNLLSYSETYFGGEDLTNKCVEFILENANDGIFESSTFVYISIDAMKLLLTNEYSSNVQKQLCLAIIHWIEYNVAERQCYINDLMDKIQFELLDYKFFTEQILEGHSLVENQNYQLKMYDIMRKHLITKVDFGFNDEKLRITSYDKIKAAFPKKIYTIIGDEILRYDETAESFTKVITKMPYECYGFAYTTFDKKNLFIGGGIDLSNDCGTSCQYYSFQNNDWEKLPCLKYWRNGRLKAITLDDKIYVCNSNTTFFNLQVFDTNKLCWSAGPELNSWEDMAFALCSVAKCGYALNRKIVQRLDPREGGWKKICKGNGNENYEALGLDDHIIHTFDSEIIYIFDTRCNKWLDDEAYSYGRHIQIEPKVCMANKRVYSFVGDDLKNSEYERDYLFYSYQTVDSCIRHFNRVNMTLPKTKIVSALFTM